MSDRPLVAYEPNAVLGWLYHRFFEHIGVDEAWAAAVREADRRGTVVYVLRNLSFLDFLALDHLIKRLHLPQVRFANDLGLWVLEPMGRGWLSAIGRTGTRKEESDAQDLRRVIRDGSSAALFLKRPPSLLHPSGGSGRGRIEGDVYMRTLFEMQRENERPILLVPQVFVWSKQPDATQHNMVDTVLGPREWPGKVRTVAQFLSNYRNVTLRAGEPVDVKAFLASEKAENGHGPLSGPTSPKASLSDDVLVRRITYTLLRRLERERRAVIGPAKKPPDRMREEVVRSPKLKKVIYDMAGPGEAERQVLTFRAMSMLREMEADLDMSTIAALDVTVEQLLPRMFGALEVDEAGIDRVRQAMREGTVVLLPSHKSHIDYIVLAYVFYTHHLQLPIIAAGENLNFFPVGPLLRRAGAFFIRRHFRGDRLYSAVVDAYIRRLIIDGFSLEFFLEGGRSRSGKLLAPKVGLLSLAVDAALGVRPRQVFFCPISVGYERVPEEKAYVHELSGGEKPKEDMRGLLGSLSVLLQRYGRISVQFGEPLSLEAVLREDEALRNAAKADNAAPSAKANGTEETASGNLAPVSPNLSPARRRAVITRLAYRVMNEINRVTAVTAGSLVATALLTHDKRGMAQAELIESCRRLGRILHCFGARFSASLNSNPEVRALPRPTFNAPPGNGPISEEAVREACALFVRAGHVTVRLPGREVHADEQLGLARHGTDTIFVVPDEARLSLDLAKNIVVHFFVSRAMVATALLGGPPSREGLKQRVLSLSRLFKYEFQFRADATFDQIFDETLAEMIADGELASEGTFVRFGSEEGRRRVMLYKSIVKNFVEGYRVAARALSALLKAPLAQKDLTRRAIAAGERMFLAGEIERREAISAPLMENAFASFVDQGYLARLDGKLKLAESYATADAVRTVEARVAGFLGS
ncbi:MAG TPA: 1-acyl-sn-glycerol-3-phosphate acyltransferase [Polyangiaceae bacterium]|nr:1-acyl-sn-glycerol-3-phosphate acyltransferase [Polyangiaceae bacterium]